MAVVIEKLNLIKFGKFRDFEINTKNGLNVIYGVNEAGKSTINLFIKAMLYGMPTRKKSGEALKERERAIPWNEKRAEGILTVNNNGVLIEIRRQFGKTSVGDKTEICYALSGEKIDDIKANSVGEWLFDIPQEVFEKTLWISQNGTFMGGRDDELLKRVSNLSESGDEVVSAKKALERLTVMQKQIKAADRRNTDGRLDELNRRLDECRREKYDLSTRLAQQKTSEERKFELGTELSKVETEINQLEISYKNSLEYEKKVSEREIYRKICECDNKLDKIYQEEEYKKSRDLNEDIVSKAWTAQERIASLEKESAYSVPDIKEVDYEKTKLRFGVMSGVGAALLIVGLIMAIVCGIILNSTVIATVMTVVALVGAVFIALGIINIRKCNTLKSEYLKKKNDIDQKKKVINDELSVLQKDLDRVLNKYAVNDADELRNLFVTGQGFDVRINGLLEMKKELSRGYDIEELAKTSGGIDDKAYEPAENIEAKLKVMRQKHIGIVTELKEIESKMAYDVREYRIPADIDTEINFIKNEIDECNSKISAIALAAETIKKAAEEWKSMITPEINNSVNRIMEKLTYGEHNDVRISDEFKIRVASNKELYDAEYFSYGTYEQLYFALRVAVSGNIDGEKPLFLDDILTTYDDKRAEAAMAFLNDFADRGQVFVFTCHSHIEKMAADFNANIIKL